MRLFDRHSRFALSLAALAVAGLLAGCSPGTAIDDLPAGLGLPAGTPARPTAPPQYPAVHDMPPARTTTPLSGEQQLKLERDLQAAGARQAGNPEPGKKVAPKPKNESK